MPSQLEEYVRRHGAEIARSLTPEQRLEGLAPKERLEGLAPKERLEGLAPEERVEGLSLEDRLKGLPLPPETIEALQKQLEEGGSSAKSN